MIWVKTQQQQKGYAPAAGMGEKDYWKTFLQVISVSWSNKKSWSKSVAYLLILEYLRRELDGNG